MQLAGDHGLRTLTQIGTVMTDPEYRGKGLAAELMNRVIGQYENESEAFYLFANDTVLDFYPRFGFRRMERMEIFTRKRFNTSGEHRFRKLDMASFTYPVTAHT
jgi:predicted GNAT family N-acyltransferase